ncbi:MAG: hypothetical protein FJZ90_18910, partial [Chloroflexi bacterium]|nr:hypothetical protein [Chloroflexota bacterium]
MRCGDARRLVAIYRELGEAKRAELRQHLASCFDCARAWETYQAQDRLLASLPSVRPSAHLRQAVLSQTTRATRATAPGRRRFANSLAVVALVLAVSLVGTVGASAQTLPGDVLYPVKRAAEQVRLAMTLSPAAKAEYQRALAAERRQEVLQIQTLGRPVEVAFEGRLEAIIDGTWIIEGIAVEGAPVTEGHEPPPIGSVVAVEAKAEAGQIKASRAEIREEPAMPRSAPDSPTRPVTPRPSPEPPEATPSPTVASPTAPELATPVGAETAPAYPEPSQAVERQATEGQPGSGAAEAIPSAESVGPAEASPSPAPDETATIELTLVAATRTPEEDATRETPASATQGGRGARETAALQPEDRQPTRGSDEHPAPVARPATREPGPPPETPAPTRQPTRRPTVAPTRELQPGLPKAPTRLPTMVPTHEPPAT